MDSNSFEPRGQATPAINVTPLIDVLLVLLIIFMVISPLRPARFKTLVPEVPAQQQHVLPDPLTLVVAVNRAGAVSLNGGEAIATTGEMTRLAGELTELFKQRLEAGTIRRGAVDLPELSEAERIEKTVFVKAPRSISYGEVARVIDAVKGAGANPVGLQIDDLEP